MSRLTHAAIVNDLQSRWPEHRIAPSLARVRALCDLLGAPQHSMPVIQIAGTNGKGSTAIMIDALLRALGLRTGRYASPHLMDLTERICIDGEPISPERFDALVDEVRPYIDMVDAMAIDGVQMTFFEVMTALAFAAFAEAPVDVAVIEVGLGGSWDATNVADAQVAVVCPIDLDHTHILGSTIAEIAVEKAGIIKPGAQAVFAAQVPDAQRVLLERCAEVGAKVHLDGQDFGLIDRALAVGGQVLRVQTAGGPVGDIHLPLFGEHMARNAALAVGAVEAFLGGKALAPDVIADGLGAVEAPARLEVLRRSPTVVLDTCHNPHGARATVDAVVESFAFAPLIGVVAMMADKDADGVLEIFSEQMAAIVLTETSSTTRSRRAAELGDVAREFFDDDQVHVVPDMADAIERAVTLADQAGPGAGILIAGSVIAAGQARSLLLRQRVED